MKYVGSKNRIAKYIVPLIQSRINKLGNKCNGYFEPFVGGGNIIDKIKCLHKYGADNNKYLIALLCYVRDHSDTLPLTVDKETYNYVHKHLNDNSFDDWFIGLVGFCASYNSKFFGGYANNVHTKIGTIRNYTDEAIRNLIKQAPNLQGIDFQYRNFQDISTNISNFVIYCDPPYRNTTKYMTGNFPYEKYYDWCRALSQNNIVLCSEYWMPDDFECIWTKDIKCTLDKNSRSNKTEKLFILN